MHSSTVHVHCILSCALACHPQLPRACCWHNVCIRSTPHHMSSISCPHVVHIVHISPASCLHRCRHSSTYCPHVVHMLSTVVHMCSMLSYCPHVSTCCPHIVRTLSTRGNMLSYTCHPHPLPATSLPFSANVLDTCYPHIYPHYAHVHMVRMLCVKYLHTVYMLTLNARCLHSNAFHHPYNIHVCIESTPCVRHVHHNIHVTSTPCPHVVLILSTCCPHVVHGIHAIQLCCPHVIHYVMPNIFRCSTYCPHVVHMLSSTCHPHPIYATSLLFSANMMATRCPQSVRTIVHAMCT